MKNWYLACYKRGKLNLFKALMSLEMMNVTTFSPKIYRKVSRTDRPGQYREIIECLFPGYFFILFDPEVCHTSKIERVTGLSYLVRFGGEIKPINRQVVEEIMCLPICRNGGTVVNNEKHDNELAKKLHTIAEIESAPERFSQFCGLMGAKIISNGH
ncbi:transcription termination/antitermination NusG family protein [Serratia sp. UGAL515B_01]|uniref:transcription termination/antitermination NusG family protein n=1 Tax=Serratia sp. UGAL515B_01 TaxID=2986763 RepID=UPI0029558A26|nr:transcription termination/antitermination NusG family protein [Serratia sp. UGAL515B_01]WON79011.1 antitermination protein NusG [Serratia sp. UGAL515B_01]